MTDTTTSTSKPSFVYLLISTHGNSYVGATVDLNRRLRQHNKEIKGGAHATSIKVQQGETWTRNVHVSGFPDWQAALQFEWRWKQLTRKLGLTKESPLLRRLRALLQLLELDRSTSKALAYSEWPSIPVVHLETKDAEDLVTQHQILFPCEVVVTSDLLSDTTF